MSFRTKIGIAFSSMLMLTIIVALTSWWGMGKALDRQESLTHFSNDLEHMLHMVIFEEQAFIASESLVHSRAVYSLLSIIRTRLGSVYTITDNPQQQDIVRAVIGSLAQYEESFSFFVSSSVDAQAMKSRMIHESRRLLVNADDLFDAEGGLVQLQKLMNKVLVAENDYLLWHQDKSVKEVNDTIGEIVHHSSLMSQTSFSNRIKLTTFRISKVAKLYKEIFNQFVVFQKGMQNSLDSMRISLDLFKKEITKYLDMESTVGREKVGAMKTLTVVVSFLAIVLSLLATIILSIIVTRPVNQLKESVSHIVEGRLETSVVVGSRDEIGELGELFNLMAKRLQQSFGRVEKYKNHLEDLVKERTLELEEEIVERKQAQIDLLDSESQFRAFYENASDGILIIDPKTLLTFSGNKTICRMLGYSDEEIVTLTVEDIHPVAHLAEIIEKFQLDVQGKLHQSLEIPFLRKNGSVFQAEVSTVLFTLKKKQYLLGVIRDITERKKNEEEILKGRKLESVGMLAGGIAHDFNNILTGILGNINLALMSAKPGGTVHQLLEEAESASIRARELTSQLLTFSKGGEPVRKLASIEEIIRDSADFVLRGSTVGCEYHFAADLWNVAVDAGQISQVIQNIVINANHSMPNGGLITISCENRYMGTRTMPIILHDDCIKIMIKDHGIGIQKEDLERIFDPYFSTKQQGSGLGLAISHSIVIKHSGGIFVESEPGKGTVFSIYLPASKELLSHQENVEKTEQTVLKTKILVMDDEEIIRDVASSMLDRLGMRW